MTQMEVFERTAANIFAHLYEEFPVKVHLEAVNLIPRPKDFQHGFDAEEICLSTLEFLHSEGFIECGPINRHLNHVENVRLTLKGLVTLKKVPKELGGKTIGDEIVNIVKGGVIQAGTGGVASLLTIAWNAMLSPGV